MTDVATHEAWRLVRTHYDDGGVSGGTMDRPALKRLLVDVEAGKIDIVVCKVDRLAHSLADFTKIVEVLVVAWPQTATAQVGGHDRSKLQEPAANAA